MPDRRVRIRGSLGGGRNIIAHCFGKVLRDLFAEEEEVVKFTRGVCSGEGMEDDNGLPFYSDQDWVGGTLQLERKVGPRSKEI